MPCPPSFCLRSFLSGREERVSSSLGDCRRRRCRCCYEGVKLHPSAKTLSKTERVKSPRERGVNKTRRGSALLKGEARGRVESGLLAFCVMTFSEFGLEAAPLILIRSSSQTRRAKIKGLCIWPWPRSRGPIKVSEFTATLTAFKTRRRARTPCRESLGNYI